MTVTIPNNLGHIYKVKAALRAKVILADLQNPLHTVSASVFRKEVYFCLAAQIKFEFECMCSFSCEVFNELYKLVRTFMKSM